MTPRRTAATVAVDTDVCPFAITVEDETVTRIELNKRGSRPAAGEFERRVVRELKEYASGVRTEFTFPVLPEGTAFDRQVWVAVAEIPYGETATYGDIARRLGKPGAARAVGTANGRNPVPPVIPCHRVVAAGGGLGGYGGGLPLKRKLLDLETRKRPLRAVVTAVGLCAMLLVAAACGEPERVTFVDGPGGGTLSGDSVGPVVEILFPGPTDTLFSAGTQIFVRIRVRDTSGIGSVDAVVSGTLAFIFPQFRPAGSLFETTYTIPTTPQMTGGTITFTAVASDEHGNTTTVDRSFRLQ